MTSPENATSVSLRPDGVDEDGRKIPGQKEILVAWKEEKLFRLSPFVRDCLEILERHPELLDTARPGLELSRALDHAEELEEAGKILLNVVGYAGCGGDTEEAEAATKAWDNFVYVLKGAPRER